MSTAHVPGPARLRLEQPASAGEAGPARKQGEALPDPARAIDLRVARRIRERRLRIGMTQQTLAQIIGVAFQQAHKYERGLSRVSAGRLFHIATALGVPIVYFFLRDEEAAALDLARPLGEGGGREE
jgi:DNA-binding XRE family transcriptional regulator